MSQSENGQENSLGLEEALEKLAPYYRSAVNLAFDKVGDGLGKTLEALSLEERLGVMRGMVLTTAKAPRTRLTPEEEWGFEDLCAILLQAVYDIYVIPALLRPGANVESLYRQIGAEPEQGKIARARETMLLDPHLKVSVVDNAHAIRESLTRDVAVGLLCVKEGDEQEKFIDFLVSLIGEGPKIGEKVLADFRWMSQKYGRLIPSKQLLAALHEAHENAFRRTEFEGDDWLIGVKMRLDRAHQMIARSVLSELPLTQRQRALEQFFAAT